MKKYVLLFFTLCLSMHLHAAEQTLSMIKPDAVKENHIGEIIAQFENNGLRIAALKKIQLSKQQAQDFYKVHETRPFYPALVDFMISGPVVVMVLEGENAVKKNRELMGATDPKQAVAGSIRHKFAKSVQSNAVHGSDSLESAKKEIFFFFTSQEVL